MTSISMPRAEATEPERRVLVQEMLEGIWIYPDHLEMKVAGAPELNVTLDEVGLKAALSTRGVGQLLARVGNAWRLRELRT